MKIPMTWLKDFVDIDAASKTDIKTFMERMTMSGSKTEGCEHFGADIKGIVTGRVVSIKKHPNADKLLITETDTGGKKLQVITAATNLSVGDYVMVAVDGAVLRDTKGSGVKEIKSGELRGEKSEGMLVSIEELGYDRDAYPEAPEDGIYVFPEAVPLGADPEPFLGFKENVVEFEITNSRPDCFSVLGIAREAAATFDAPLLAKEAEPKELAEGDVNEHIKVRIDSPDLCPRYCARVVKNVKIAPSPRWLRLRLVHAGLRPINNIVDITNYVMHELGQPMHAFDVTAIRGGEIIVRNARAGEVLTTLDGERRVLDEDMLLIADKERGVALAGVMGGEESKITDGVGMVLLESANFCGINVRTTAKKLGMRTDSSAKFEKRLDPNMALAAINRAAALIEEVGAGEVAAGVVDCYPGVRNEWEVPYSVSRVNSLLGTSLSDEEMENLLGRLGIKAKSGIAKIPTFRPDIRQEADLAEEIARLYGYDNIQTTLAGSYSIGKKSENQLLMETVKGAMSALSFHEALTFSFESPAVFDRLRLGKDSDLRKAAAIRNPLGEEFSVMRTTTIPAMLTALSTNYSHRTERAALYEAARIYLPPKELNVLTMSMFGGDYSFFEIKGAAETIIAALGITADEVVFTREATTDIPHDMSLNFLHPGRKAVISVNGVFVGFIGEVHPEVSEGYDIETRVYAGCMYLDALLPMAKSPVFEALPRFPGMNRDIAIVADENIPVADILSAIRENGGEILREAAFFDEYKGKGIGEGKRSLAFSLSFRHNERTLVDKETAEATQNILNALKAKFGAVLRT